jgi:hypothetical protein
VFAIFRSVFFKNPNILILSGCVTAFHRSFYSGINSGPFRATQV